jgi:DNA anti-recombination protein RmuC
MFLFSSGFVVIYALSIYIAYSGVRGYQLHKIKKLERELVEIKSKLYDGQKEVLERMQGDFEVQFENFKRDNEQKFDTIIKFNQYTLEKVLEETNGSFEKYKKETQKLLRQAKGVDSKLVEKLMFWR